MVLSASAAITALLSEQIHVLHVVREQNEFFEFEWSHPFVY